MITLQSGGLMTVNFKLYVLFFCIMAVILSPAITRTVRATEPDETTLAEDTMKTLEGPLTKEFGRPMTGKLGYEGHQSVVHVIAIDYQLKPGELDAGWGEKVVRALEAVGAADAAISSKSDWGPTEVRAESLPVGERKSASVQFVISQEDNVISCSMGFLEMGR